uniref:Uncharacterized protein n=1 Tax=Moniliophthora roreri TaxID=221103 RepID=A0A0W0EXS9_MONRR
MNPATVANSSPNHHPFSMSDIDTFSDSDWLDIASSRESDIDSLSNPDSDRVDVASTSLSRRSSFSSGSSRDGDVDAWEGFVEDTPEAALRDIDDHLSPLDSSDRRPTKAHEDSAEERRVLDGLEQSLISTLSASRSSSHDSTVHNSLRDLRLSFPDPLTSSRDDLPGFHDNASSSPTTNEATEPPAPGVTIPVSMQDPGPHTTPEVRIQETVKLNADIKNITSEIFLYGMSSSIKWTFVQELLGKAALGSGRRLEVIETGVNKQCLRLTRKAFEPFSFHRLHQSDTIIVHDRTGETPMPSSGSSPSRPSLAILFLPCKSALAVPLHTSYIPVIVDVDDGKGSVHDASTRLLQAHVAWGSIQVPFDRILTFKDSETRLVHSKDVKGLNAFRVHRALRRFALLSLIIGLSVHNVLRSQARDTHLPFTTQTFDHKATATNSTALAVRTTSDLFVAPASLSTVPPVYERGSTAVGTSTSTSVVTYTKPADPSGNKLKALTEKLKVTRDVIAKPSTPTTCQRQTTDEAPTPSSSKVVQEEETASSLSIRLVDSLSEIIEVSIKALVEVVHHDIAELMQAIDELMNAIHRQTRMVAEHSRSAVQTVKEHFEYRNARAKGKAMELREKGLRLMSYASDAVIGRTRNAKKRAQVLKANVAASKAWAKYDKVQGEWASSLGRRARRGANHRCRAGKDGRYASRH